MKHKSLWCMLDFIILIYVLENLLHINSIEFKTTVSSDITSVQGHTVLRYTSNVIN